MEEAKLEEELLAVKREAAAARDALKEKDHSRNEVLSLLALLVRKYKY